MMRPAQQARTEGIFLMLRKEMLRTYPMTSGHISIQAVAGKMRQAALTDNLRMHLPRPLTSYTA